MGVKNVWEVIQNLIIEYNLCNYILISFCFSVTAYKVLFLSIF